MILTSGLKEHGIDSDKPLKEYVFNWKVGLSILGKFKVKVKKSENYTGSVKMQQMKSRFESVTCYNILNSY